MGEQHVSRWDELLIYTDGGSRGNPGEAAIGVRLLDRDGNPVEEFGERIGVATNNVAEYTAVIRALERARALGARRVRLRSDSELLVRQLLGRYAVKTAHLLPLYQQARRLLGGFEAAGVEHVPRERNREADRLANLALDGKSGSAPAPAGGRPAPASQPAPELRLAPASRQPRRSCPFRIVDAFTAEPLAGNPAGVVPDAAGLSDEEMQRLAREVNASETAFVLPPSGEGAPAGVGAGASAGAREGADFRLRFFTPRREVDLCGHATVAAFHVLAEEGRLHRPPGSATVLVRQETRAGILPVEVRFDGECVAAVMMGQSQPRFRPFPGDPAEVARILGVDRAAIADDPSDNGLAMVLAYTGLWHLLVPIRNLVLLGELRPDQSRLAALNTGLGADTTHVFTLETLAPDATAHARSFAPALGVNEDPQTGTASGALGAYLVARGKAPAGQRLVMEQGHEMGRPGQVWVEVDPGLAGVRAGGPAVVVARGEFLLG